ncbi:7649_t:CDS:2, partial [Entrophospora sp. SA101]
DYEEERNGQEYEKISIKHAIKFTAKVWKKVTSQTIVNCWKKLLNDLQKLIDELTFPNPISVSEYIEIDDSHVSDE